MFNRLLYIIAFNLMLTLPVAGQGLPQHENIQTELITTQSDGLILKQSFTVDVSVQEVWPYFTQTELYTIWAAPLAEVNFKINGSIKANYNTSGSLEDEDTITIHILNYIPHKLITLQPEFPDSFPDFMKKNEDDFYYIIEFTELKNRGTQITSYGLGYKNDTRFNQMIEFFAKGNFESYQKLITSLE